MQIQHPMHKFHEENAGNCSKQPTITPQWSPYADNQGTVCALSGEDFVVLAADTRLTGNRYSILSREQPKWIKLTPNCFLAAAGMAADRFQLQKVMRMRIMQYTYEHRRWPSIEAIDTLLARTLYYKRFFPYYTFNILVGIDCKGAGALYCYDAIGSGKRIAAASVGSGNEMAQPTLDLWTRRGLKYANYTSDQGEKLLKDVFEAVSKVDIHTGDSVDIIVIKSDGATVTNFPIRCD